MKIVTKFYGIKFLHCNAKSLVHKRTHYGSHTHGQLKSQLPRNFTIVLPFEKSSLGILSVIDITGF